VEVEAEPEAASVGTSSEMRSLSGDVQAAARIKRQSLQIAGVGVTPEIAAIFLVYFVQGILGLSRLAKEFFVKDELGLDPAAASLVFTVSSIPWLVKPLWGFISDAVPLFGYRRKSYLALCGVLGTVGGVALATVVKDVPGAAVAFTAGSLSTAFADVVIDGVVVARARVSAEKTAPGALQSLCWGSAAFGGILSAYYSGSLIETHGTRFVFGITALFPLLIACAAALVREDRQDSDLDETDDAVCFKNDIETDESRKESSDCDSLSLASRVGEMGLTLWSVGKQRAIWAPTLFVFLWQATPNPGTAMFYFQTNELGFAPEFLGRVALARAVAALLGVGVYNAYFKDVPLKKMFFWSAIAGTALGMTQLILVTGLNREWGIDDRLFSLGDSVVLTVLGEVSFLPVLVLAARVCPEGVEATLFAALMSVFNAGGVVSGALGAGLTKALGVTADDFENLFWLVLVCNLSSLAPLAGLGWLDEAPGEDETGDEREEPRRA
jgi:folate/biopterin transporter